MQRRCSNEGVNAASLCGADRLASAINVLRVGARQPRHHGVLHELRDLGDGLEIAIRCGRKPGFDNVDAHLVEQLRDLELLLMPHGCAGRLFAVPQRRIENQNAVFFGAVCGGRAGGLRRRSVGHHKDSLPDLLKVSQTRQVLHRAPRFNPQALARRPGSQRSGANKEKKAAQRRWVRIDAALKSGRHEMSARHGHDGPESSTRHNAYFAARTSVPRLSSLSRLRLRRDLVGSMSLMARRNVSRNLFVSARNTIHHGEQNARYDEGEVQTDTQVNLALLVRLDIHECFQSYEAQFRRLRRLCPSA